MYVIVSINANYISPVDKLFVERSKKNSRKNMLISMSRLLFLLKTYFFVFTTHPIIPVFFVFNLSVKRVF